MFKLINFISIFSILAFFQFYEELPAEESTYSVWHIEYGRFTNFPHSLMIENRWNWGNINFPGTVNLIKGNGRTILFDTGLTDEPTDTLGGASWRAGLGISPFELASDALQNRFGISPSEVDTIIVSHIHADHFDGHRNFPNARVYVQLREILGWQKIKPNKDPGNLDALTLVFDPNVYKDLLSLLFDGRLSIVFGDREIIPGIKLFIGRDTHTPGAQWALVNTNAGKIALTGDIVFSYTNLDRLLPIGFATGSRQNNLEEILNIIKKTGYKFDNRKVIIPAHDAEVFGLFDSWVFLVDGVTDVKDGLRVAEISVKQEDKIDFENDFGAEALPEGQAFFEGHEPLVPQPVCNPDEEGVPQSLAMPKEGHYPGSEPPSGGPFQAGTTGEGNPCGTLTSP